MGLSRPRLGRNTAEVTIKIKESPLYTAEASLYTSVRLVYEQLRALSVAALFYWHPLATPSPLATRSLCCHNQISQLLPL